MSWSSHSSPFFLSLLVSYLVSGLIGKHVLKFDFYLNKKEKIPFYIETITLINKNFVMLVGFDDRGQSFKV